MPVYKNPPGQSYMLWYNNTHGVAEKMAEEQIQSNKKYTISIKKNIKLLPYILALDITLNKTVYIKNEILLAY